MKKLLFIPIIFLVINCFADKITTMQNDGSSSSIIELWHFNNGSGSIAFDSSLNKHHGTITGATWTDGLWGGALNLDGINDLINLDSSVSVLDTFTISAWLKWPSSPTSWTPIFNLHDEDDPAPDREMRTVFGIRTVGADIKIYMNLSTDSGNNENNQYYTDTGVFGGTANYSLSAGNWYNLVVTYNGVNKTSNLYVNGEFTHARDFSTWITTALATNLTERTIGSNVNSGRGYLKGEIEEILRVDRILTSGEVSYLYSRQVRVYQ